MAKVRSVKSTKKRRSSTGKKSCRSGAPTPDIDKKKRSRRNVAARSRTLAQVKATAHHEAGHAVAMIVQDLGFDSVTIMPEGTSLGSILHPNVLMYDIPSNRNAQRALTRQLIIACYAGIPAQSLVDPSPEEFHGDGDEQNAFELSREWGVVPKRCSVGDDAHIGHLEKLRGEAKRLVRRHETVIHALTAVLLKEKTMDYARVREVLAPLIPSD